MKFCSLFVIAVFGLKVHGGILLNFSFEEGSPATETSEPSFIASGLDSSSASFGSGIASLSSASSDFFFGSSPDFAFSGKSWNESDLAGAEAADDYLRFSLTGEGLNLLSVDSLSFEARATSTGPKFLVIDYSSNLGSGQLSLASVTANDSNFYSYNFDLSGIAPLNFASNAEFSIYAFGGSSAAGTFSFDDVLLSGTVIPEPSTVLPFTALFIGALLIRRRRA